MGFDEVDREHRRKEIKLECEDCGITRGVTVRHTSDDIDRPLCKQCFFLREQGPF